MRISLVFASCVCFLVLSSYYLRRSRGKTAPLIWLSFPMACTGMLTGIADTFYADSDFQHLVLSLSSMIASLISVGVDPDYCVDIINLLVERLFPSHTSQPEAANQKRILVVLAVFGVICRFLFFVFILELMCMLFLIVYWFG